MPEDKERDRKLARIMLRSKMDFPSTNLESVVMSGIQREISYRVIGKNKKMAFVFIVIEVLLGLFINFTLARYPVHIPWISPLTLLNVFQMAFLLIVFFQLEQCLSLLPARRHHLS